jgi:hypothetical protein
VINAVVAGGGASRVARLLHPQPSTTIAKPALTDPFSHPGAHSAPGG